MALIARFETNSVNMRNFESEYVYREYPKWVKLADGTDILVKSEDEEAAAVGESTVEAGYDNLRDALMQEAKALGLNPHHRTGADKLREMVEAARKSSL